jgi:Tfp pilus assembly protein PilN
MIQFNLLPDVKLEYIRAKRMKRTFVSLSMIVIAVSAGVVLILVATVYAWQRTRINNLTNDITQVEDQIRDIEQIDRILTVQNQLRVVNGLHDDKPVTSRLFDYIGRLTPSNVSINSVDVDFEATSMQISGTAENLAAVNKFADTLKFVDYTAVDADASPASDIDPDAPLIQSDLPPSQRVFSAVVLSSFSRSEDGATYSIDVAFRPEIFDSRLFVTLILQEKITTRSEIEKPAALFTQPIPEETD